MTSFTMPTINDAKQVGRKSSASGIAIIAIYGNHYSITTWGKDRKRCKAMKNWSGDLDRLVQDFPPAT